MVAKQWLFSFNFNLGKRKSHSEPNPVNEICWFVSCFFMAYQFLLGYSMPKVNLTIIMSSYIHCVFAIILIGKYFIISNRSNYPNSITLDQSGCESNGNEGVNSYCPKFPNWSLPAWCIIIFSTLFCWEEVLLFRRCCQCIQNVTNRMRVG